MSVLLRHVVVVRGVCVQVGKFAVEAYALVGSHKEDDVQMFYESGTRQGSRALSRESFTFSNIILEF